MNYNQFFNSEKDDKKLYALVCDPSEERGGTDKPSAVFVSEDYRNLLEKSEDYSGYMILEVRNGALFILPDNVRMSKSSNGGVTELFEKSFNPEGWQNLVGQNFENEDEDEDGDDTQETTGNKRSADSNYLVVLRGSIEAWYFNKFSHAFQVFIGASEEETVDLFKLNGIEAKLLISTASIHQPTNMKTTSFSCYDYAYNPYTTCTMGCKYCYAHVGGLYDFRCLPQDLKGRVVIGSHCDPYHATEATTHGMRTLLRGLNPTITKVGIFTKSPLIIRDIDLLLELMKRIEVVVHFNLSPFPEDLRSRLEPGAVSNMLRVDAIRQLKQAGIKVVVNICPCMAIPDLKSVLSSNIFKQAYGLADEICIGLTMLYGLIPAELSKIEELRDALKAMTDIEWDHTFLMLCRDIFTNIAAEKPVVWRDTGRKGWVNLYDLERVPQEWYNGTYHNLSEDECNMNNDDEEDDD